MIPPRPRSTLFPYTTLFRSDPAAGRREARTSTGVRPERLQRGRLPKSALDHRGPERRPVSDRFRRPGKLDLPADRKSTRLNSSHLGISYAVFCLKKKKK